jgi:O-antigen/teichoic acid export membrane protein
VTENNSSSELKCGADVIDGSTDPDIASVLHRDSSFRSLLPILARGIGWSTSARIVSVVGSTLRFVIFARLLSPVNFGIFGAAVFCFEFLYDALEPNFEVALVPMEKEIKSYLNTIWTVQLVKAALISLILYLAAHELALYFKLGAVDAIFVALIPVALLRGSKSPASTALISRELNFRVSFVLCVAENVFGFLGGLVALFWWRDWRVLVISITIAQAARTTITYYYYPYRPRLEIDWVRAREMFLFGRWITLKQVALFVASKLDNLAVGHLLGPVALAEYQMAFRIGEVPVSEFAISASAVSFPLSARFKGNSKKGAHLFYVTIGMGALIGFSYCGVMFEWGPELVSRLLGPKWLNVIGPLEILCLYGVSQGVLAIGTSFLEGLGRPSKSFQISLLRAALLAVLIYPLTIGFGTRGAAIAGLVSLIPPLLQMYFQWRRTIGRDAESLPELSVAKIVV